MGSQASKIARSAGSAASRTAAESGTAAASKQAPSVGHYARGELPKGYNPDAPRGQRRPKLAWEVDMTKKPTLVDEGFHKTEDLKSQLIARELRSVMLDKTPQAKPSNPTDIKTTTTRPSASGAQRQPASTPPGVSMDLLNLILTSPAASPEAIRDLAARTKVSEASIAVLRQHFGVYRVQEAGERRVGVWADSASAAPTAAPPGTPA
ncbi:hypothetical protein AMAG_16147 [Allomyces macrogynus ATCC 38327]|uniref:Uncharacterized protein n=1 Tax=Allomyces macrogynus (strain ATCC 38327) TaxID=578462 RepID=A0A0L0TA60_ALLM3|nr:hypothetical protein AMAG_16147 [Allomyces macrogynus ATCC 38327]|eukprot:KNE71585.1 hypothetical protein AMAG_16147 [Allomyces macrogynus ATCC 38327]